MADENFEDTTSGNERHSARNPACDLCREKKVRCGREKPRCQSCVVWKANCTYSERAKRDNEASRNAQRFEEVNERLDRIESTMLRLVTALESAQVMRSPLPDSRHRTSASPSSSVAPKPRAAEESKNQLLVNIEGDLQYLGSSSLRSFTSEAETLVEERLKASVTGAGCAEQSETMSALRKLSTISSKSSNFLPHYGHKELRHATSGARMEIPPREETEMLMDCYFREIHHWFPIYDETQFRLDVDFFYKNPEAMRKDMAWQDKAKIDPKGKRVRTFFYNAWFAIDDLDVFLGPRLRNVQALMSAAVCAIEVSRPGLCWSLLSQAARTSQAIGLHRKSSPNQYITKAQLEERKYVFWNVFILDKCLSLSLGRSTCLPDYDCDVEFPEPDDVHPFFGNFLALIKLAKIHSQIYIRLYSASAIHYSEEDRELAIRDLDTELRSWLEEWCKVSSPQSHSFNNSFEHIELQFSYHSSLTLVHRMARPGMRSYDWSDRQCLENARSAIRVVNSVVAENKGMASSGMLLWLFQYYPFTSFFVLFSAIIRNPSASSSSSIDYPLMKAIVAYLSQMKAKNQGAAKLLAIASALTHVADAFLKNYLKVVRNLGRPPQQKRRRPLADIDADDNEEPVTPHLLPPPLAPRDYTWLRPPEHPPGYNSHSPPPPQSLPQQQHAVSISMPTITNPVPSADGMDNIDLQAASFLRWPSDQQHPQQNQPAEYDIDLEALMAEPVGSQMQMEQAALRGPLEFDWFGWDGQFASS